MNDLYQKKYQYERLIKDLNNNYSKLETLYSSLKSHRKKIDNTFQINDFYYASNNIDMIIKNIEKNKDIIKNSLLPQARYQYNNILLEISKL